jgi:two-component system, LytTR family, response regulator
MITCAIIDDEPPALEILEKYIQRVPFLQHVASFDSSVDAALALKAQAVDLIFLDIHMPELSGLQLVKLLSGHGKIIFTTAHRQYALDAFEYNVLDYLLKPISFERFLAAVHKAQQNIAHHEAPIPLSESVPNPVATLESDPEAYIFVKINNKVVKVFLNQILYLEGLGNYVGIHTFGERLVVHCSIKDLAAHLPSEKFMRVHKSYLIAVELIKSVEGNQLFLEGGNIACSVPLGAAYREAFFQYLQRKMVN